jgi:hypothetical protein
MINKLHHQPPQLINQQNIRINHNPTTTQHNTNPQTGTQETRQSLPLILLQHTHINLQTPLTPQERQQSTLQQPNKTNILQKKYKN